MAVYVDNAQALYYRFKMSHMIADSLDELHAMADKLGLERRWFQDHNIPHYDLSQSKRALAIKNGAIVVTTLQLIKIARHKEA